MNMCWHDLRTINELAASFARLEGVEALLLAGSTATGLADEQSDYDLYAYTRETVPVEFRAQLLKPRAARLELHNTFWEWSDEWLEPDGTGCLARACWQFFEWCAAHGLELATVRRALRKCECPLRRQELQCRRFLRELSCRGWH
jgi:nucleotidyltransferase-like protein